MFDFERVLIFWLPHTISTIACISILVYYFVMGNRTQGLKMIMILAISDLMYHLTLLLNNLFPNLILELHTNVVATVMFRFSLLWKCNMAFFLYRLLNLTIMSHPNIYMNVSLIILFPLTVAGVML